jgi:ferredoxin
VKRLSIDWSACAGHGHCALWAPDLVERDQWGFPMLLSESVTRSLLPQARAAVRACPALALELVRSGAP